MKQIELTEEHKKKLLEMCKILFPEFQIWTLNEECHVGAYNYDFNNLLFSNELEHHLYKAQSIHWFEFCMTHLQNKLFRKLNDFSGHLTADYAEELGKQWNDELMMRTSFFFHNPTRNEKNHPWHPIDYLYSQFKKLEL